ncbi:unnamed protein product [Colias eurytheme]|nr:unnamed protein product [Colias eurytheme]
MRYFSTLQYFRQNGPIFIYLGGEGVADPVHLQIGVIQELAQETGGAMFMTEHRYYGLSKPFPNLNTENLKWLSSAQALADIAKLITYIKSDPKFMRSKVVLIGGSYAGNLAAWMRLKFPNLVDAAYASSSPVLAKKDFYEYLEKEFYLQICKDLFGADFNEAKVDRGVQKTNQVYGGLRPNVTRVVFVNGDVDPWSTLSILVKQSSEVPAVVIPGAIHCQDLSATYYSREALKQATKYAISMVKTWIGMGNGPRWMDAALQTPTV